jgi:hypothetical protein
VPVSVDEARRDQRAPGQLNRSVNATITEIIRRAIETGAAAIDTRQSTRPQRSFRATVNERR